VIGGGAAVFAFDAGLASMFGVVAVGMIAFGTLTGLAVSRAVWGVR
jgi:hypothetical protein